MKLLMYNPLFTVFTKEEKDFLSRNAKMDMNKIDLELETIFKHLYKKEVDILPCEIDEALKTMKLISQIYQND